MNNQSSTIIQRLWNYCNVLCDGKIEKELDGTLPCGDDMVRAERLRGAVLKSAACPASAEGPRQGIAMRGCWEVGVKKSFRFTGWKVEVLEQIRIFLNDKYISLRII